MAYKCEILADSISEQGHRLTTFKITYPRIIHAEMLRHRMLSRNVASSRAIPFEKMVKDVESDPFIPIAFQRDHKGMQGTEYIKNEYSVKHENPGDSDLDACIEEWLYARTGAVLQAKELNQIGVTKQLCNRLLEPFVWTTELVSGTEWENFFSLRCPKYCVGNEVYRSKKDAIGQEEDEINNRILSGFSKLDWLSINESQAEIHIQKIAEMMWDAYNESVPKTLQSGEWHIPYGDNIDELSILSIVDNYNTREDQEELVENAKLAIATARAARISYTTLGDNPKIDYEADIKLHDRLLKSKHASPFEHMAQCQKNSDNYANFKGWKSYRFILNL